jgi:hypothetical protein
MVVIALFCPCGGFNNKHLSPFGVSLAGLKALFMGYSNHMTRKKPALMQSISLMSAATAIIPVPRLRGRPTGT